MGFDDVIPGMLRWFKRQGEVTHAADPGLELHDDNTDILTQPRVVICRVKCAVGGINAYVVNGPGFYDMMATDQPRALSVLGARTYATYHAGDYVYVSFAPDTSIGAILGAVPRHDTDAFCIKGTQLIEGAGVGVGHDLVHRIPFKLNKPAADDENRPVPIHNGGRPWDTVPGDTGAINEFGVGYHVGKFNASLHAGGGAASVLVSYLDNTVFITGDTHTTESPTYCKRHFNDQGEGSTIEEMTPYLWEGLGAASPKEDPTKFADLKMEPAASADSQVARYVPKEWDQIGLFRYLRLAGFLGGGDHTWMTYPKDVEGPVKRNTDREWPGLLEVQMGFDGFITMRTAKGLLIEKTCMIPVPAEKREPADPKGDMDDACDYGKTAYDKSKIDYDWGRTGASQSSTEDPTARTPLINDHNAFRTGEANMRGLLDHVEDWHVPDENYSLVGVQPRLPAPLGRKFHADMPPSKDVDVDHRRKIKYYASKAFMFFGDEGSIMFQDAYGSTISMVGGNIEICPAGDLIFRPGRSIQALAPRDINLVAGHNAELVADNGDVRIKAQNNLHTISGVSGDGGTLIENRSTDKDGAKNDFSKQGDQTKSYGIMFKTAEAPLVGWSNQMYFRTMVGNLVLDSNGGKSDVSVFGNDVRVVGNKSAGLFVGTGPDTTTASGGSDGVSMLVLDSLALNAISGGVRTRVADGQFSILGSALVDGVLNVTGAVRSPGEHMVPTKETDITPSPSTLRSKVQEARGIFVLSMTTIRGDLYAEKRLGHANTYGTVQFSFNTSESYRAVTDFVLHETYWQTAFSLGAGKTTWERHVVSFAGTSGSAGGSDTMAWPGNETWTSTGYGKIESVSGLKNVTMSTGVGTATPRDDTKGIAPTVKPLKANYVIDNT